ncbi:hypothetical protein PanWU01x14_370490, partial [Parasponia andersonii]
MTQPCMLSFLVLLNRFGTEAAFGNDHLSKTDLETWCVLSWLLGGERNNIIHGSQPCPPDIILHTAEDWIVEYKNGQHDVRTTPTIHQTPASTWTLSCHRQLKLNVGVHTIRPYSFIGIGAVIRDFNGALSGALACCFPRNYNGLLGHCLAIREGLNFCIAKGFRINEVEVSSLAT